MKSSPSRTPRTCATVRPVEWVNISEAARRLGVSRKTVHRWIAAGELEAVDTPDGKRVLLPGSGKVERDNLSHFTRPHTSTHTAHVRAQSRRTPLEEELRDRLERAEARIDTLLVTVSEQNHTIQAQIIRLAQLEGRILDHSTPAPTEPTPSEQPHTAPVVAAEPPAPPRRYRGLRALYMAWRRG